MLDHKQATSELVQYLVDRAYVTRTPAPRDRRARPLVLTERGDACTRAAAADANHLLGRLPRWGQITPSGRVCHV